MKNKRNFSAFVLVALLLISSIVYFYTKEYQKKIKRKKSINRSIYQKSSSKPEFVNTSTPTPELIKYDYIITKIKNDIVFVKMKNGNTAVFPKDPRLVKIFKGDPEGDFTPAGFKDLKIGQKIRVKRIPGKLLEVYILK